MDLRLLDLAALTLAEKEAYWLGANRCALMQSEDTHTGGMERPVMGSRTAASILPFLSAFYHIWARGT